MLGGLSFGPYWGSLWVIVAATASTTASYGAGRFFTSQATAARLDQLPGGLVARVQTRPFETTVIMRLLYLPFDAVGYLSGFLRLPPVAFLLASTLGTIPGIVAFVGFGASIDSLDEGMPTFDLRLLAASVVLAVLGAFVARQLRKRQADSAGPSAAAPTPTNEMNQ